MSILEEYETQKKEKNCLHCGFKGICEKYQSLVKIALYVRLAGYKEADISLKMGQDCNRFEYYLGSKFN
jgi:hypothetical protein